MFLLAVLGCAAIQSEPVGHSAVPVAIASRIDDLGQKVEAVNSRVEQSIAQNDTVSMRIMVTALAAAALLGYVPGKLAWQAMQKLARKVRRGKDNR